MSRSLKKEDRLKQLGLAPYAKYADPVQVAGEIEWSKDFFKQHPRWRLLDISNRAIEEAAASIINAYKTGKKPT